MAFVRASYWDVEGEFTPDGAANQFTARLSAVDGDRVASGRDFADDGTLRSSGVVHLDEAAATSIAAQVLQAKVRVTGVQEKPYTRRPSAPFTTSTLQQEASRKLRLSSKNAMRVAQRLYENGYITYMRTDSTTLSEAALTAARQQARDLYGADYVPDSPRRYERKVKNAQEAHEAIRPAGDRFRTPAQVAGELRGDEFALYELIWKRTVASQMADARGSTATVKLGGTLQDGRQVEFSASGTVITFRGFLAAYEEGRDVEVVSRNTDGSDDERRLPKLSEGVGIEVLRADADGHETTPPPRYTEATLVKAMEEKGIGRPSTYASTVGTIQDRGYVHTRGSALVPTWLAFAVTRLLEEHFSELVDYDFTASMEEDLDRIAGGEEQRSAWLKRFYFGDGLPEDSQGLKQLVDDLGEIDAREISTIPIGDGIVVRVGRYGPYVEETVPRGVDPQTGELADGASDTPRRATINDDVAPDEMTPQKARELLEQASDDGRVLGRDPQTGREVVARAGRYGPYVTEVVEDDAEDEPTAGRSRGRGKAKAKPRTASLFKDMDLATIDLDTALKLLSLPRLVGTTTEEDGTEVEITAQNGRYGPYLKKGTDSRSLQTEQQLFDITLEEALAIYAQPKQRGRAASAPLKELGDDPVSGKPMVVKDGRFGPYVTDGETNATLRKADDPGSITPERGAELLAEKRAKGPTTRKRAAKKATRKATKRTAKKTAKKA
jgi:DNA topoisomerase-1